MKYIQQQHRIVWRQLSLPELTESIQLLNAIFCQQQSCVVVSELMIWFPLPTRTISEVTYYQICGVVCTWPRVAWLHVIMSHPLTWHHIHHQLSSVTTSQWEQKKSVKMLQQNKILSSEQLLAPVEWFVCDIL